MLRKPRQGAENDQEMEEKKNTDGHGGRGAVGDSEGRGMEHG